MSAALRLMLVTNRKATRLPILDVVRLAVRGGVDAIQVREKDLSDSDTLALTRQIVAVAQTAFIVVNGSLHVARQLNIGVHLPEAGPTIAEARAILGPSALIGRSIHSARGAQSSQGADYLVAGHVFETGSKPEAPAIGLEGLSKIIRSTGAPVLAIGGINRENVCAVLTAGARGVAVMSTINQADDPEGEAAALAAEIDGITITLNGRPTTIARNLTIQEFLIKRGFKDRLVVVEINAKIAPKSTYSVRVFEPEDSVEIVHFVGGG